MLKIFDGWYFFTKKWEVFTWIVQIRTASITRKRKRRAISWDAICLVAATARKDIVRSSSVGKESRCDMELKVGMKAIIVNSRNHSEYNFQMCEIKEIENSHNGKIYVELHSNKLVTNFYIHRDEIVPLIYENPEDLKKYGTTVEDISKLFTEYKGYYDVICKVAEDISHESEEKEEKYKKQIEEMQHHIDSLKSDLAEAQEKIELPHEPIKVAETLIDATGTYKTNSLSRAFGAGDTGTYNLYSKSDLRQIAEHLLVYCNNAEE